MVDGTLQGNSKNIPACDNLFKPASWLSKIDFINHLILFNNILITVLAEKEGGKSSFAALLQTNLDLQIQSCTVNLQSSYDTQTLMEDISIGFELEPHTDLTSIVQQINKKKSHCLLLIDDAEHLDKAWIKEALTAMKQQGDQGYFHLCLIADYSMINGLNHLACDFQNMIHTIELSGLNEIETQTYIQYRARAENIDPSLLTEKLQSKIYQATAGDLAKIHANIGQYISDYTTMSSKGRNKSWRSSGVAVCVALAAAGLGYSFSQSGSVLNTGRDLASNLKKEFVKPPKPMQKMTAQEPELLSQMPSWREEATVKTVKQTNAPSVLDSHQINAKITIEKTDNKPTQSFEQLARPSAINAFPGFKTQKTTTKISTAVAVKPVDKKLYTIQLIASHKEETIKHFMQVNKLTGKSRIYNPMENDKSWFVLTLGEYDNLDTAKAQLSQLPTRLNRFAPWIRPLHALKERG